ncbi:MAG: GH92 family glycosyl hydrolase [Muribaculaceae bacterium]|nr:GH92 family glycosyl hydrolase [Muribaculaceae bacterium]
MTSDLLRLTCTLIAAGATAISSAATDFTRYVNPLMGSQSSFELSAGNTYPAIARPWGMNFWTPQTGKMGDGWTYCYDAHKIRGIKQTHQPSPWINDYGQFSIMATTGVPVFDQDARSSWFSHKGEDCRPYYYKVYLADYDVVAEVTPTERAAMFSFTFPESESSNIVIDAFDNGSSITVGSDNRTIHGYTTRNSGGVPDNFKNYFIIEFDKTFDSFVVVDNMNLKPECDSVVSAHAGAIVTFNTRKGEKVNARVASSFISLEQAARNLRETGGKTFEQLVADGRDAWNRELAKIAVEGGTDRQTRTFYSCLYRSLLFPRKFYEIGADGRPYHYSPHTGEVMPGYMFTDTGLWDTFRALFPLLNLCYADINAEIQEGLLNHYRESGFIPEWASPGHRNCMVGNNSASVLADAYLSGVKTADTETLWKAATAGTAAVHPTVSSSGRLGHDYYNSLGYVPYDVNIHENVARTLEYAYDDWCIYRLAKALDRPAEEQRLYARRALNYRNVFDKETNLMRGRNADGRFQEPFSPLKWGDAFTEGNSWHYTWSVFHDPQGLIDLMGGRETFVAMLDSVFATAPLYDDSYYGFPIHEIREMTVMNMGNYAHGNQPIQHMIYLYNYAGQPWKAQRRLHEVMERMYSPDPDGYCGDEDNGQTSAWYVFSALGFYPVAPGSGQYVIGTPLFKKATLTFDNGRQTVIETRSRGNGDAIYISEIKVNGKHYSPTYFNIADLKSGIRIKIDKSDVPDTVRGTDSKDFPYSFSNQKQL